MDFGLGSAIGNIASSTSAYLLAFSPVFLLIGGLVLALGILDWLFDRFFPDKEDTRQDREGA